MVRRVVWVVALVCLILHAHAVHTVDENDVADIEDANVDDQLSALFDDDNNEDLGEPGPDSSTDLGEPQTVDLKPQDGDDLSMKMPKKHVDFEFKKSTANDELGESPQSAPAGPLGKARGMIQLGSLLESLSAGKLSHRTVAVSSLKQALETKLLMDELKPTGGSFAQSKPRNELGEAHSASDKVGSFNKLLKAKRKDMAAITSYLLERKKEGRPLTAHEDDQLQKFYYNRASTILKKIVLLKRGDMPPEEHFSEETHDVAQPNQKEEHAEAEVKLARQHAQAVVERLQFDAKVATANAVYNKKMLQGKERRMKAATEERKQAEKQQLKAAKQKLMYDQKVADAEEHYNEALSTELLQRKQVAEKRVQEASEQKRAADIAAARATAAAHAADKEAKEAEDEAEAATRHAEELEAKELEKQKRKNGKQMRGHTSAPKPSQKHKAVHIPLSIIPHAHLQSLLRYLHSALDRHQTVTPEEQELMQSFFLKQGSSLLSQLAQVDPDATWHSRGVVREEQYEMDRGHPDRLSKEWGSKNLKGDTVVTDFVRDAMWAHKSNTHLARPDAQQEVFGLFGNKHKVALAFAPDASAPQLSEPDLGESSDDDDVPDMQKSLPGAISTMMGLGD